MELRTSSTNKQTWMVGWYEWWGGIVLKTNAYENQQISIERRRIIRNMSGNSWVKILDTSSIGATI
jgi:hypothetical protein